MKTSAKSLRTDTKAVLEAVDRGEIVVITFRGAPRAKIVPLRARGKFSLRASPLFGLWRDDPATADVDAFIDRARASRS
jgi:prevent-host-death family protein